MENLELLRELALKEQKQDPGMGQGQAIAALTDTWTGSNFAPSFAQLAKQQQSAQSDPFEKLRKLATLEQYGVQNELGRERLKQQKDIAKMKYDAKANEPTTYKSDQYKAAGFGLRMQEATKELDIITGEGYDPTSLSSGADKSFLVPDLYKSENTKRYSQAQANFINANLRRESGAAISPTEFSSANKQYFPQVGDTDKVLSQKKRNRKQSLAMMKAEAGGAFGQVKSIYNNELGPEPSTSTGEPSGLSQIDNDILGFLEI